MSQENVEIVRGARVPVTASTEAKKRSFDQRLFVRFPALARAFALAFSRLPPSSRLRRAIFGRLAGQLAAAFNRRDFACVLVVLDPEIEFQLTESPMGRLLPPDLPKIQHGPDGCLRMWEALIDAWDDLKLKPEEVIDFGERVLGIGRIIGHGRLSGIALDSPIFQVVTLRNGLVVRQKEFAERQDAFNELGLSA
jgi:ketosteroid isomerase-like protein